MVQVFQYSKTDDNICINITKINGEFTKEEQALLRKANALAELNDPVWDKMDKTKKDKLVPRKRRSKKGELNEKRV